MLGLADHFADRRVDINHHITDRANRSRPRPLERVSVDRFELADMPERERPQERPQRRRRHHPMTQHRGGRTGAQHVRVVDVGAARDHRVGQRQHLPARSGSTDTTAKLHRLVDHRLQREPLGHRCGQQQTGVRDQIRIIE